ncbi:MAG: hypothetical protein Alpg2KO_10410 [Alphaproteobacteria bacterium]
MAHLYFCDTEYTTWPGAMENDWSEDWQHRELVQIAALKVDAATLKVVEEFECLVKPVKNPQLSDLFIRLTAVTQEELDQRGLSVAKAFAACRDFMGYDGSGAQPPIIAYGNDNLIFEETAGLNDLTPPFPDAFHDCRDLVRLTGTDPALYSSGTVFRAAGLSLGGHVHNALHDCNSMVAALQIWDTQYPALRQALNRLAGLTEAA